MSRLISCVFLFTGIPSCSAVADIAFLVDSSGSIGRKDYVKVKQFVAEFAKNFDISPSGSRAAVILYSNGARTEIFLGEHSNWDAFNNAVLDLDHQRGLTRIDLALQLAYRDIFGPGGSARRGVQKIAVVLTDGKQTVTSDAQSLDLASAPLRKEGVYIFAMGIGKEVDRKELRLMTETDADVLVADSFDDLRNRVDKLGKSACEGR